MSSASAFVDAFSLTGFGRALDEVLGFLEAQAGDGADFLDRRQSCSRRPRLEDDGELGLRLGRGGRGGTGGGAGGGTGGSGGGDAPLALQVLDQRGEFDESAGPDSHSMT